MNGVCANADPIKSNNGNFVKRRRPLVVVSVLTTAYVMLRIALYLLGDLGEIWNLSLDGGISDGGLCIYKEKLYIATDYGRLYRVDGNSGKVEWTSTINFGPCNLDIDPTQGKLVVGTPESITAFNPESGSILWEYKCIPVHYNEIKCFSNAICVAGGTGYALSPKSGRLLWTIAGVNTFNGVAAGRNGTAFFESESPNSGTYAYNAQSGTRLWKSDHGGLSGKMGVTEDGKALVGDPSDHNIYSLNPQDGSTSWKYPIDDDSVGITCGSGGKLYVTNYRKTILCLSTSDGTCIWRKDAGEAISPRIMVGVGHLYLGAGIGTVLKLNAKDGNVEGQDNFASTSARLSLLNHFSNHCTNTPHLYSAGSIIVTTSYGKVYRLKL